MKVAVTGSAGFLGWHLVQALLAEGHNVVGVDNRSGGNNNTAHPRFADCKANIRDRERLVTAFQGCSIVYHCAALAYEGLSVFSPHIVVDNIVGGSISVMSAAVTAGVKRVVNCSSMARYGNLRTPYEEIFEPNPVDPYGMAKLQAEQQMNLISEIHGVGIVHTVPHNIIGPGQKYDDPYRNVASIVVNRLLQGKSPIVYGDGSQVRCFSYVGDIVPVFLRLGSETVYSINKEVFNVGPDKGEVTILQLVNALMGFTGICLPITFVEARPREVKHAVCSSDKIRRWFKWEQKTGLMDALWSVVKHISNNGTKPFDYRLPIEIVNNRTPKTWTEQMI